ncbi:Zc3h12a-like Ribonuclease NYN domain-containing protein [Shimia gijangensis]|uniref:Zc3h12a-like Ribonuclease NYN domain-containing protein n=1 Tax=Shimia gijangensis TaxID=1470563 RepID=A0A1M6ID05_9RHOB|nr:hypothetical protein [Shimia gijangensis]SHJ32310.1 Zc3h12a-like Ribonuclease NYN domain-containing protein [Shimia gijangensis]
MIEKSKLFEKARGIPVESTASFTISEIDPFFVLVICVAVAVLIISVAVVVWRFGLRRKWIVVDGSNVLFWDNQSPFLETVRAVLSRLSEAGYSPIVFFDANVGYLVGTCYFSPSELEKHLPVSKARIIVAEKGIPADPLVISKAKRLKARVVTNDRFRDWAGDYPEVQNETFFVRGRMNLGQVDFEIKG